MQSNLQIPIIPCNLSYKYVLIYKYLTYVLLHVFKFIKKHPDKCNLVYKYV